MWDGIRVQGSKRRQSCPRLQFDVRIGNVNKQIGNCDDKVELGCQCALWEGEGVETMLETIPQQTGSAPHQKQVLLTSTLAIGLAVRLRYTVLAHESGQGGENATRAADLVA